MAKAKFKVLVTSFIDDRLYEPGEIVEFEEKRAGRNLERIGKAPDTAAATAVEEPKAAADDGAEEVA